MYATVQKNTDTCWTLLHRANEHLIHFRACKTRSPAVSIPMQEISIWLTVSSPLESMISEHLTTQNISSDSSGRRRGLLKKTAAMQSKTDDRRTTDSKIKIFKHTFFIKLPLYVLTVKIQHTLFIYWSPCLTASNMFCCPATIQQQQFALTNKHCIYGGDSSTVGLIVSYSAEKHALRLGWNQERLHNTDRRQTDRHMEAQTDTHTNRNRSNWAQMDTVRSDFWMFG